MIPPIWQRAFIFFEKRSSGHRNVACIGQGFLHVKVKDAVLTPVPSSTNTKMSWLSSGFLIFLTAALNLLMMVVTTASLLLSVVHTIAVLW
jgi:hypothetical protein